MMELGKEDKDLHGNVPDKSGAVLILVDVINDLDFPDNEYLVRQADGLADRIVVLKKRCAAANIPIVYVNDNRGKWRSDVQEVVSQAQRDGAPGRSFARKLAPGAADYVVLKPKHSIFFATPLDLILEHLGVHIVIVAGITTNACILISAGELFVRGFRLVVPSDCVAALTHDLHQKALALMNDSFKTDTTPSDILELTYFTSASSAGIAV